MSSRFLFNEALWDTLGSRIPTADAVRAAVAYLGSGASALLPLRRGDKLVVDMSLRAVRSGTTDPREVRTFLRKGVEVFSRGSLHAKFFVIDKSVIAGSSNISKHAKDLDEAAVLTNDPATVRRASATFELLCTEPVRKDYLLKCIKEYRPPKFLGAVSGPKQRRKRVTQGKVWIISGLRYRDLPEAEQEAASRVAKKAARKLLDFERSEVDYSHYPSKMRFFGTVREGDWAIVCVGDGKGFNVSPPARFLGVEHYARGDGKQRYLALYETPTGGKTIRWSTFRRAVPASIYAGKVVKPRTTVIADEDQADALLRLWDARGRFRSKRTR